MSNSDRLVVLGLAGLVLAAKLPTISTPYFWDEVAWIGQVHRAMASPLWHVLPGVADRGTFGSRPFGMFLPMAALFKLTGPSIWLTRLVMAVVAAVGVCFTYRLGALLYGEVAGIIAALLLAFSPMYFAQAGMFLADLPVTAFGVASVYWACRRAYGRYLFCAVILVLLKETAMAIVAAVSLFVLLREWRRGPRPALREAVRWALPLLIVAVYYSVQKLGSGSFFMAEFDRFTILDVRRAPDQLRAVTRWLFMEQLHWLFAMLIAADLIVHPAARRRPELLLFALIVVCSGYSFSVIYFLPRYLLPVFPYLCVAAAGALVSLFPRPVWHVPIAAALVVLLATRLPGSEGPGTREWDLGYLDAVRAAAVTAERLERSHADDRIVTTWPLTEYLRHPELGYVSRPLHVVSIGDNRARDSGAAVVVDTSIGEARSDQLTAYARAHALTLVDHIQRGSFRYDIYAAPR